MEDKDAARTSIYLQITLMGVSVKLNIVLRGRVWLSSIVDRKLNISLWNECSKDF